jgi:RNA polymerase primary sigma factor
MHEGNGFGAYLRAAAREPLLTAEEEVELARTIEAGVLAADRLATRRHLPARLRADLAVLVRDGERAKRRMIEANLRLVVHAVRPFLGRGVSVEDVVAEGNLGLIRAVEKFDYARGYKFSTYATWWIRQAAGRALAAHIHTVRVPMDVWLSVAPVLAAREALRERTGQEPTPEELAEEAGVSLSKIERVLAGIAAQPTSLDRLIGNGDDAGRATLADYIEDADATEPGGHVADSSTRDDLERALRTLGPREAEVLRLRYGLDDGEPRSLTHTADLLGLSLATVAALEAAALRRLRHPSRSGVLLAS